MQARMVATNHKVRKAKQKDEAPQKKAQNAVREASRAAAPRLTAYFADHASENVEGFSKSGKVSKEEIEATPHVWKLYLMLFVLPCQRLAPSSFFNGIVYGAISLAIVLVGLETYVEEDAPGYTSRAGQYWPMKFEVTCNCTLMEMSGWVTVKDTVEVLDQVVNYIFLSELVVKFFSYKYRPLLFFYEPMWAWNVFDLLVVVLAFAWTNGPAAILRLMRLARLLKIFKKIVQLQVILKGLVRGLHACIYVFLLLLLIMYFYAIMGITFFRDNDGFHFGDLGKAMVTLPLPLPLPLTLPLPLPLAPPLPLPLNR